MLRGLFAAQTSLPARSGPYDQPRLNGEPLQDVLAQALGGLEGLREILDYALTAEDAHPLNTLGRIRGQIPHRATLKALRRLSQQLAWRGQDGRRSLAPFPVGGVWLNWSEIWRTPALEGGSAAF